MFTFIFSNCFILVMRQRWQSTADKRNRYNLSCCLPDHKRCFSVNINRNIREVTIAISVLSLDILNEDFCNAAWSVHSKSNSNTNGSQYNKIKIKSSSGAVIKISSLFLFYYTIILLLMEKSRVKWVHGKG